MGDVLKLGNIGSISFKFFDPGNTTLIIVSLL